MTRKKNIVKPIRKGRKPRFKNMKSALTAVNLYERANKALIAENVEQSEKLRRLEPKPFIWVTGSGHSVAVTDMLEEHLRNTISYLQRRMVHAFGTAVWLSKTRHHVDALSAMMAEADRRGLKY